LHVTNCWNQVAGGYLIPNMREESKGEVTRTRGKWI
jgi:hypothetical protein